jgi:cytochrome b561
MTIMRIRNTRKDYGLLTKLLHWTIAILIIGLIALGWYMVDLTYFDKWYNESLAIHKGAGMFALALGIVFVGWRFVSPSPDYQVELKPWERVAAGIMHHTLYAMMLLIPVTGYFISTSAGKAIDIFGWFEIPAVVDVDKNLRDLAIELHYYLGYGTAVLICLHAGAALKHQFVDRDGTLARMIWR